MFHPEELRDAHGHWSASGAIHQALRALGGAKHEEARNAFLDGAAPHSMALHTDSSGAFRPGRAAEHDRIVEHFLAQGIPVAPGGTPEAIFTAGGPASGKSSLAGKAKEAERNLPIPRGAVHIDPDMVKEHLPEFKMLNEQGRKDIAASFVHEESSALARRIAREAMARRMHVVVDGVGNSEAGKFAGKIRAARKAKYHVTVRYAHTSVGQAIQREKARSESDPNARKVGERTLKKGHRDVARRFMGIKRMKGIRVEMYSTRGRGRPKMIAVRDPARGEGMHVIDRPQYQEALGKRNLEVPTSDTTQPVARAA